ncbi:MAG: aromatic amino acid lyase, partial [Flavobacteriaceae bacterium]
MPKLRGTLGIAEFYEVIFKDQPLTIDDKIYEVVDRSFEFLDQFSKNKIIYGVNTGFGPMAQYRIRDY